ncbi:origin recognition complex subunit 2 isoform X1 [Leptidea sinapis]|uniref:origin recognition complex subunit 2 isoform X1 n=2 Tax=Leptidea sinapis TaxID=189913 RepID=UPI00212E4D7B|nr:origin recognition complex subunit 2 isoform X1 [Leptidea sinapis]
MSAHKNKSDSGQENVTVVLTPRRVARNRLKPKRYDEFLDTSPSKRRIQPSENYSSEEEFVIDTPAPKPKALFGGDDVEGQDMFKFKSRHTKLDLHNKVQEAVTNSPVLNSPMKTPRVVLQRLSKVEATPKQVFNIMKKRIIQEIESDSSETDFSGSSSEYAPDDSESDSGSNAGSPDEDSNSKPIPKTAFIRNKNVRVKTKDCEYIVAPDNYFMMNSSKTIATSDHTLARLKTTDLNKAIKDIDIGISKEHSKKIAELNKNYDTLFDKWLHILSENFNLILYGIGSKRDVLHRFQARMLHASPCIVINGFYPSLTVKSVLETIIVSLLGNTHVPSDVSDIVSVIDTQLSDSATDLFLLIHNIDGPMLRNGKAQSMLASLSALKNVHTIATIDHINAPLLWDHTKLMKYNFTWWDVTTLLPYTTETSFENSLMSQRSGALQLSSLKNVYQSLTTNAKGIFNIIIEYQLENHKQPHYQGLAYKDLYSRSREQFLVSYDLALRAQLTEFIDHKLVKIKRTVDGTERLIIPIESALLQQFLEQQNEQ